MLSPLLLKNTFSTDQYLANWTTLKEAVIVLYHTLYTNVSYFRHVQEKEHEEAIRWLGRHLLKTRNKGIILKSNMDKDIEVYVDSDFT